jgi:hypothetical protein
MTLALGIGLFLTAWSGGTLTTMFGVLRRVRQTADGLITAKASRTGQLAGTATPIKWRGPVLIFLAAWGVAFLVGVGLIGFAISRASSN